MIIENKVEVCEYCGGTGEVTIDVLDRDSGQYQAGVGTQKCVCKIITKDYDE
jgi:hypothetical protein